MNPVQQTSATAVFSTSVEVFLGQFLRILVSRRLLHVRGGVSALQIEPSVKNEVFSTSVEVFLTEDRRLGCQATTGWTHKST